ncbi:GMC oxidoreductase [Gelidibacter japonicus]|uniref:GMC oxidoreductase n=1 Tax=Gelidibacter japonicus TaxID=1962232 RepID=UPI003A8CB58B
MFEYAVVGSGPAGISAALQLNGPETCLIDVGDISEARFSPSSLKEALVGSHAKEVLGDHWEMLDNLINPTNCHPKLRAQAMRYICRGEPFKVFGRAGLLLAKGCGSFAKGGMANVWGGQLLRYNENDLGRMRDWPISIDELNPFYSELERHIGISGINDDMGDYLGGGVNLLPPTPLCGTASKLLQKFNKKKKNGHVRGLSLGHARLAVLTKPYRGREAYSFTETEFFRVGQEGIYSPAQTLNDLKKENKIKHFDRHKLLSYEELEDRVILNLLSVDDNCHVRVEAKKLLLGCGTIQSTKLILENKGMNGRELPFIDHPPTLLPIFFPMYFGTRLPMSSYPIQLIGSHYKVNCNDMISFYYTGGMLWSDMVPDIPMPLHYGFQALKVLIGGMLVAQIWEDAPANPNNKISLKSNGEMEISYPCYDVANSAKLLATSIRSLGGLTSMRLASLPIPSWGFHHAGTLPMRENPSLFETHVDGRLWDSKRVYIIDGSVLPSLPAKNCSLTIMANSARIAVLLKKKSKKVCS